MLWLETDFYLVHLFLIFFFIMLKYTEYNIQHFNHFEVYSSVELNHLRCAAVTTVYLSAALSSQAETVSPRNDRPDVPHPARGHTMSLWSPGRACSAWPEAEPGGTLWPSH